MSEEMLIYPGATFVENVSAMLENVNKIGEQTNSTIVFFNAEKMAGEEHVRASAKHAISSFSRGENTSRTLSMEILLYASGQRQLGVASGFGLHEGINHLHILILGRDTLQAKELLKEYVAEAEMSVMVEVETLMELFSITKEELDIVGEDRIEELVVERVALVEAWK